MTAWISASRVLSVGLALALNAQAATLDGDEARIEILVRAERAVAAARVPPPADTDVPAIAIATAVAPPPEPLVAAPLASVAGAGVSKDGWVAPVEPGGGLPFNDLVRHIGDRVAVVTAGARVHRGIVKAADAEQMILQVHSPDSVGAAAYTLRREQIVRIDLR